MRKIGLIVVLLFVVILILPSFIVSSCNLLEEEHEPDVIEKEEKLYVSVLNTKSDEVMNLELDEYIKGVVAAEMPVKFHIEALKAQAIAARTYTLNRLEEFGGKPDEAHPQYELCTDSRHCQAWISKEERLSLWKNSSELSSLNNLELWSKIEEAVESTKGIAIVYNDELIDPLFHSTSGGKTENSEDYFSASLPYLRSVSSEYEENSPYLNTSFDIEVSEFKKVMTKKYPDIEFEKSKMIDNIEILSRTEGGKVDEVKIGNKTLSGREVRELLGIRSSDFTVKQDGDKLVFTVSGFGHGVGLSQYGADGMAREGYNYEEILKHYYTGTELEKVY